MAAEYDFALQSYKNQIRSDSGKQPEAGPEKAAEQDPATGLIAAIESAFTTGEYTDLTIQCQGTVFKAHKLIVCGQSKYFANAVKGNAFKEGQTGIVDLPCDDPPAVKAMLQYMYTFDYEVPKDNDEIVANSNLKALSRPPALPFSDLGPDISSAELEDMGAAEEGHSHMVPQGTGPGRARLIVSDMGEGYLQSSNVAYLWRMQQYMAQRDAEASNDAATIFDEEDTITRTPEPATQPKQGEEEEEAPAASVLPQMLFHLNVYALADRIQSRSLKQMAESKFSSLTAKDSWRSPDEFAAAIEAVYGVAPPGPTGASLRSTIVRLAVTRSKALFQPSPYSSHPAISDTNNFSLTLQETPEFAADLARALAGVGVEGCSPEPHVDIEELRCPDCGFLMRACLPRGLGALKCPACRWEASAVGWRNAARGVFVAGSGGTASGGVGEAMKRRFGDPRRRWGEF